MTSRADRTDTKRDAAPRDGFKTTEIGELPAEWGCCTLADVAVNAFGGGTPSTRVQEYWDGEIPWTTTAIMSEADTELNRFERSITRAGLQHSSSRIARQGTLLVGTRVGVGKAALASFDIAINQDLTAIELDKHTVCGEYVAFLFKARRIKAWFAGNKRGSTIKGVPRADLLQLLIPLPPLPEQRAIARVLRTVQEAIEATERAIEAAKELKRSMMEYLFTYGPVPVDQAEKVEVRQIEGSRSPSHWATSTLGEIARVGNGSTPKRSNESYWQDGTFPWLTSGKVHELLIREADEFVTEAALSECHLPRVKPGNLVVAITGQGKTLGLSALVDVEATINQHLAYVALRNEDVLPEFLLMFLRQNYTRLREIGQSGGSTKAALTCGFLRSLVVPVPPLEEQQKIVAILGSSQLAVDAGEHRKQELDSIFNSLLHHLMTGKVRVTPTEADFVSADAGPGSRDRMDAGDADEPR